jgi:hypothetical protein
MMRRAKSPIVERASFDLPGDQAIIDTSSNSAGESGGKIVGSRAASIDFPAPGGPIMSMLFRQ